VMSDQRTRNRSYPFTPLLLHHASLLIYASGLAVIFMSRASRVGIAILICLVGLGGWLGTWLLLERSRNAQRNVTQGLGLRTMGRVLWILSLGGAVGVGATLLIASDGALSGIGWSLVVLGVIGLAAGAVCFIQGGKRLPVEGKREDVKGRLRQGGVILLGGSLAGIICGLAFLLITRWSLMGPALLLMGVSLIGLLISFVLVKRSSNL